MNPTLSVILPACNEERSLGDKSPLARQLAAILGQSRPCTELLLRDDGSTDGTLDLMRSFFPQACQDRHLTLHVIVKDAPSGINRAFNDTAALATGDWLYLCSANDLVQPGAFAAWERGATAFPDARIAVGSPHDRYLGWLPKMGFLTPAQLKQCFRANLPHGCGTFIRRDAWEQYGGYREDLGSLADFWFYNMLSAREGVIYLPERISRSSYAEIGSGHIDVHETGKRREIVGRIEALLAGEFADVREFFEMDTMIGKTMRSGT